LIWISACCVGWAVALPGCETIKKIEDFAASHPDVRPEREKRARDVAASYDRRRDEIQLQVAVSSWRQGNPEGCRELLTSLLRRNPTHREAQLLQIELALVEEHLDEARQWSESLLLQLPSDAEVAHIAAMVCDAQGDEDEAREHFRRAAKLEPNNQVYAASLAEASASEPGEAAPTNAMPASHKNSSKIASDTSAALLKAQICLTFDDCQSARRLLEELLARQPQLVAAQQMLREAIDPRLHLAAKSAKPADSEAWQDWRWQRLAQRPRSLTPLVAQASEPAALEPDPSERDPSPPAVSETAASETATSKTVAFIEPPDAKPSAHAIHNRQLEEMRKGEPALVTDDESLTAGATSSQEKQSIAAAVAALRQNRPELALDLARHGLDATPDSAGLYRTIGTAEYRRGDYAAAQEALQQSLTLDNTHPLSYFLMGCTLNRLGQSDEAERFFLQARQLDSRYAQESPR
jgi:tetratricopeptide (TPR) repeat protein